MAECGYRRCTAPLTLPGIPWCEEHHRLLQERLQPRECLVCWAELDDPFALFCSAECRDRWPAIWESLGLPVSGLVQQPKGRRQVRLAAVQEAAS